MRRGSRNDLVDAVCEKHGLGREKAAAIIKTTLDTIVDTTQENGMLVLHNFGTFRLSHRKSHITNNPRTGQPMMIAARDVITFKQSRTTP